MSREKDKETRQARQLRDSAEAIYDIRKIPAITKGVEAFYRRQLYEEGQRSPFHN